MSERIPNIFHLIYNNKEFGVHIFLSIKSIIEINKPISIYFHYDNIPEGYLWDIIKDKLILKKINVPIIYKNNQNIFYDTYKNIIIFKNLIEYGGIYIDINSICIKPFTELLKYPFIKSSNNEIVCSERNSPFAIKYFKLYSNEKNMDHMFSNINLNYDNSELNIYNIIFEEITNYSFATYFNLIKETYFISLSNNISHLDKINLHDVLNKITIYNLLVKHMLAYNYINNNIVISNNHKKFELINNIDYIYWINLEESTKRKDKMIQLLKNINIKNIRVNAINGRIINNIDENYFICDKEYPKYSNKEYAILLSHLNTINLFTKVDKSKLNYGVALILEDDISFDFINYWDKDIKTIISEAPEDWDIIMLGYFSLNINNEKIFKEWNNEWSAISYLVNQNSIKPKIDNLKKDNKWICNENDLMVSDNYIFSKFNTYIYKYPYFTFPNDNDSTFHSDHLNYHRIYKICNYLTLNNVYESLSKK